MFNIMIYLSSQAFPIVEPLGKGVRYHCDLEHHGPGTEHISLDSED